LDDNHISYHCIFREVTPHTGAYCRYCDSINQKSGGKIGIPIIVIGLIITIIGVIRIILGNVASKSKYDKTFTEMRFIQNMKSEKNLEPGIVYMPPTLLAKLRPESK
jgi:hypothetical protein